MTQALVMQDQPAVVDVRRAMPFAEPAPAALRFMAPREGRLGTGVRRLDALLGGGYPAGSAILLQGPSFCGKHLLMVHAAAEALRSNVPTANVLLTRTPESMSALLRRADPGVALAEESGLVTYVDLYSRCLGERSSHPNALHVEDPVAFLRSPSSLPTPATGLARGVPRLLVVESVSSLLVDHGQALAFAFLRSAVGRTIHEGGVALMGLESGMHPEPEVQMAKHLATGLIELRRKGESSYLHIDGLETAFPRPGWVEYEAGATTFKVTGSYAGRTIR